MREKVEILSINKIHWLGIFITAAISAIIFLYTTFVTKDHWVETQSELEHRLERIENKLDRLLVK